MRKSEGRRICQRSGTYREEVHVALPVEKVHRLVLVVDVFGHRRRQQRDLGRVDRPWGCLSGRERCRRSTALCGRERVATQVHEFARKRLGNDGDGVVHGLLGLGDAAVDDDVVDDAGRNRDHAAQDRVGRAADSTRLARGIVLARKDGDATDKFFLVVQVEVVRGADGVFGEPNEDLEDAEVLDRLKVGRKVSFAEAGHSDVRPGGPMEGQHGLLGVDAVKLCDFRARLLALFEAR